MHSDYYGKAGEMEFFSVEATFKGSMPPESVVFQDFVRHTKSISLFDGEIELVGSTLTEYAYPIYQLGYESKRDSAISAIQALGIDLVGRQGAFDYMPAADFAVKAAVDLVSRRFCGYPVTAARSFTEL